MSGEPSTSMALRSTTGRIEAHAQSELGDLDMKDLHVLGLEVFPR